MERIVPGATGAGGHRGSSGRERRAGTIERAAAGGGSFGIVVTIGGWVSTTVEAVGAYFAS